MIKNVFMLLLALAAGTKTVIAQHQEKQLIKEAIGMLEANGSHGYTYRITTISSGDTEQVRGYVYRNLTQFEFYTETPGETFFLNKKGMVRVSNGDKTVQLQVFSTDKEWQDIQESFKQGSSSGGLMDSLLFAGAMFSGSKKVKGQTVYSLTYAAGSALQSLVATLKSDDNSIQKLEYLVRRNGRDIGIGNEQGDVRQWVEISDFSKKRPSHLQALPSGPYDLKSYLAKRYPDYLIKTN